MNPEDDTTPAYDPNTAIPAADPTGIELGGHFATASIDGTTMLVSIIAMIVVVGLGVAARAIYSRYGITRAKQLFIPVTAIAAVALAGTILVSFPAQSTSTSVPEGFGDWASETYAVEISDAGAAELIAGGSIAVERDGIRYLISAGTDAAGLTYLFNSTGSEFMRADMVDGGSPAVDPGPLAPKDSEVDPATEETPEG